jgi:hypothetical protein
MATVVKDTKKAKSLIEMVKERTRVDFKFVDIQEETTTEGDTILRFIPDKPLEHVVGRVLQGRRGRDAGKTLQLEAFDVAYIRFGTEAIAEIAKLQEAGKDPFTWDIPGKSGEFNCPDLKFDVSASNREVWVVKTSLQAFGQQNQGSRFDTIQAQIDAFKAKKAMENTPIGEAGKKEPEAVGGEG